VRRDLRRETAEGVSDRAALDERIVGRVRCGSGALGGGPALCVGVDGRGVDGGSEWSGMTTGGESGRIGCVDIDMNAVRR